MSGRPQMISVMTPFPDSIDINAPLGAAREFMSERKFRHLPVTDNNELCGILSDRDIKLVLGQDSDYSEESTQSVADVFQSNAYVVDVSAPLDEVLLHMARNHIDSAIVTRRGKLAGIFTSVDACRSYGEYLQRKYAVGVDDTVA